MRDASSCAAPVRLSACDSEVLGVILSHSLARRLRVASGTPGANPARALPRKAHLTASNPSIAKR